MALLFMDSFDHYATADLTEKWTASNNSPVVGAYGRNSTNGLRCSINHWVSATVLGGITEAILAVAIKPATMSADSAVLAFGAAGHWQCGLGVRADGTLQPFRVTNAAFTPASASGSYVSYIGSASTFALSVGVWTYLEVRIVCSDTVGVCQARANGSEILNLTSLDTSYDATSLTRIGLGGDGSSAFYYDDLVVMDTTGSLNNAFMGDVTVSAIYPSAAGNSSGWTPSAGSNYQCVDESSPNDDTDYNATSTVGTKDTYAFANAPAGADIRAVQVLAAVRKGAEGPGQVKLVTRSGSTDYDGAAQGIGGTTYSYVREVLETDPATSAAWTESGFNAAEFGIKKVG
jgi:hypothetical protein